MRMASVGEKLSQLLLDYFYTQPEDLHPEEFCCHYAPTEFFRAQALDC